MIWTELKTYIKSKNDLKYVESDSIYEIWLEIDRQKYVTEIYKDDSSHDADKLDFETNYKPFCNASYHTEIDVLGRWIVRSDSKRRGYETVFAGAGDDIANTVIGGGQEFMWDFSSTDNDSTPPSGYKQKRIDWQFIDGVYMKEGAVYFYNALQGSYINFYVICPAGGYYMEKTFDSSTNEVIKTPTQAVSDTIVSNWVIHYLFEGSCPMGDELNTESASDELAPQGLIWRVEVTVPDVIDYELCHGHWCLEFYRPRSVIFT